MPKRTDLLSEVAQSYTDKLTEHGVTPRGVDWNGIDSQTLRFRQLCEIIDTAGHFSINDLGCGYGALYEFLPPSNVSRTIGEHGSLLQMRLMQSPITVLHLASSMSDSISQIRSGKLILKTRWTSCMRPAVPAFPSIA